MACPCELLIETDNAVVANQLLQQAKQEALRIEQKYSRYRKDNIVFQINSGKTIVADAETALLLNFAQTCYELSEHLFDVTSGVLANIWDFKRKKIPTKIQIAATLPLIGWNKVKWDGKSIQLRQGMAIDFGGIGKEYAVDKIFQQLQQQTDEPFIINLGGDLRVNAPLTNHQPWSVGAETHQLIKIYQGALATSGDTQRYFIHQGKRYSHVLNPISGLPIENAPNVVTVNAPTCIEAGMLSTLALLKGEKACTFLDQQQVDYWVFNN
jgi:FAD:protein FMN transferase